MDVPLEQDYTTLHKDVESRPGLRNVTLHEIEGLVSGLENQRYECQHKERKRQEDSEAYEHARARKIERLMTEDEEQIVIRDKLRTQMRTRITRVKSRVEHIQSHHGRSYWTWKSG